MNLLATLRPHVWAMPPEHLAAFLASCEGVAGMIKAGAGPFDKASLAANGERVLQADIAGDTASLHLSGTLMTGVPWWAYAYGMDVTDLGEANAVIGELAANPKIRQVFLSIDSPGGQATAAGDVAQAVANLRASGKSVQVSASGMLCSAAYWIAAAAGPITVTPTTIVGSIGTYLVLEDSTTADAKAGYTYTLIASGGVKGHGADGKVTDTLKGEMQSMVDGFTSLFVAGVAAGRGMDPAAVQALATGQVWLGADAKAQGLVDRVTGEAVQQTPTTTAADPAQPTVAAAAPTPAATAQSTTTITEPPMALDLKRLAAFAALHATQSLLILTEQGKEGATNDTIEAAVLAAESKAKDDALATALAKVETLTTETKAKDATIGKLQAQVAKAQAWSGVVGKVEDPGADASADGGGTPTTLASIQQAWNSTPKLRTDFGDSIATYVEHLTMTQKLSPSEGAAIQAALKPKTT